METKRVLTDARRVVALWRHGGVDSRPDKVYTLISSDDGLEEDGGGRWSGRVLALFNVTPFISVVGLASCR